MGKGYRKAHLTAKSNFDSRVYTEKVTARLCLLKDKGYTVQREAKCFRRYPDGSVGMVGMADVGIVYRGASISCEVKTSLGTLHSASGYNCYMDLNYLFVRPTDVVIAINILHKKKMDHVGIFAVNPDGIYKGTLIRPASFYCMGHRDLTYLDYLFFPQNQLEDDILSVLNTKIKICYTDNPYLASAYEQVTAFKKLLREEENHALSEL